MAGENAGVRQRTNVTLPEAPLREARQLNINLSQACERGLAAAVSDRKAAQWRQEIQTAMSRKRGLPLAEYRQF
jgi:antitoxin CcdA